MTKVLLKNMRGYDAFVSSCVKAASDLALLFVGEPDDKMIAALNQMRANLKAKLSEEIGAETAAAVAEAFVGAVAGHRREIEAAGSTSTRQQQ